MHLGGAGPRGVQGEPAQEAETVKHLAALDQFGDPLVVHLLVKIQPGLLAAQQVHFKLQTVQANRHDRGAPGQLPGQNPVGIGQPFELAGRNVISFDDGAR